MSVHLYLASQRVYAVAPDGEIFRTGVGECSDVMGAALDEAISWLSSKIESGAQVELLLASSMVRFVSVPWVARTISSAAIRRQVERTCAESGDAPGTWHMQIQWPRYGWPTFAIGYPTALVATTRKALLEAGLRTGRTMATAVAVISRYGHHLPKGEAFVGFQEEDGLTGVHMQEDQIAEIEYIPNADQGLDALDVWGNRKRFEFPDAGRLRWLQSGHCPCAFRGSALTADESGTGCVVTDLLMAIR